MDAKPTHKRSKSSRVLHLLRPGTRTDGSARDSGSDNDSSPIATTAPSGLLQTAVNNSALALSDSNRLTPIESSTSMTSESGGPLQQDPSSSMDLPQVVAAQSDTPSLEDSIRTFRLFEVLRSKDNKAIQQAIQDSRPIPGSSILHLAIQCAEPQVVDQVIREGKEVDINAQDKDGDTPLHLAAQLGRGAIVKELLELANINDAVTNRYGKTALDLARTPEIFQQLQLARSMFIDHIVRDIHNAVAQKDHKKLEDILTETRVESVLDVNGLELATDQITVQSGGTLLHEAARNKDIQLAQILLLHGADPFRRDRKGRLPQDVTKDERTRAILKRSPAAAAAQRGIQEKAILGTQPSRMDGGSPEAGKDAREMKGYLKKWTNYTSGYKLRWFVLEDGVLSYYKHQDDAGSACRGAINMRIARLHMDPQDKTRFELHGKSSVKYHLKANHVVEAKRWFWALNNAIQYTKDEAKEEEKRRTRDGDSLRQTKGASSEFVDEFSVTSGRNKPPPSGITRSISRVSMRSDLEHSVVDSYEQSLAGDDGERGTTNLHTATIEGEEDMDGEDASSREMHNPATRDAFSVTSQSAQLQVAFLGRMSAALQSKLEDEPSARLSDPDVVQALSAYQVAVNSLNTLLSDLLKISKDRDAYWQYRLDRDADARRMWEESMAQIAYEHEDLKKSIAESEDKRKRTKRALKEVLEGQSLPPSRGEAAASESDLRSSVQFADAVQDLEIRPEAKATARGRHKSITARQGNRRKSVIAQFTNLSDSESGDDDEFFDAVDAGEVEIIGARLTSPPPVRVPRATEQDEPTQLDERAEKQREIEPSYVGYEDGIRSRLRLDGDNRPKISLWGVLKSMIGKDMTRMTLPVSFNEPINLMQRVAEDMEYADMLDIAADRPDSTERLVYVAAWACSEYASTVGRVAKPFNPLLGETFEYVRPDKGYRFFAEQVSHHPPIAACLAESARWEYWGESNIKTKFLGKSFDINHLGTWFLRILPANGAPAELYTWKKVANAVTGIITGSPVVDNYGPMQIKNLTTGESCLLDFKARGWKASSAFQVTGKVMGADGVTKWSMGGRWNDKIYARVTEGFEDTAVGEVASKGAGQAVLVWQAHERPSGIPFNLTPFVITLNALTEKLRPNLAPTDTRLRPDQRAMEDGEYDVASSEKNRVEEKQRAARRRREAAGEEWRPKWFDRAVEPTTGEEYWQQNGLYWKKRQEHEWSVCDDIF